MCRVNLEYHGFAVREASSGPQALSMIHDEMPDVVLLDVMMPGLNGLEVYDRVRADRDVQDMPVLFVTAASKEYESEFANRKISDVITKPFDLND
ncbi:MAG: PleD family two-component system response regulator, partial [Thermoplasmatota archaeon]